MQHNKSKDSGASERKHLSASPSHPAEATNSAAPENTLAADVADIKQRITRNPSAYAQLPMQDVHRFNDRIHANEKADVTKTFETIRLYIKDREETYTALYKATRKCDEDAEKRKREKVFKALMEFDEGGMKPGGA